MNRTTKNILGIAGVIGIVIGIIWSIPAFLQGQLGIAIASTFLVIGGLILLAISFGE